jgi:hypothetical protein
VLRSAVAWLNVRLEGLAVSGVFVLALATVLGELAIRHIGGDPLWDYSTGLWQLAHSSVVHADLWAQGQPSWVNPEWFWADILAVAGRFGYLGWVAVSFSGFVLYLAGLLAVGRLYRVAPLAVAVMVVVASIGALPWWGFRPQVWAYGASVWAFWFFGWLTLGIRAHGLGWFWARWWSLGLALVGEVFWAQFHGSWLLFPAWVLVEFIVWLRVPRVAVFWAGLFVVSLDLPAFLNPYGWDYLTHSLGLTGNGVISEFIAEWMTPNFHVGYVVLVFGVFVGLGVVGLLTRRWDDSRMQVRAFLYLFGFAGAALYAVRFLPYLPMGFLVAITGLRIGLPRRALWFALLSWVLVPGFLFSAIRDMPSSPILASASLSASEVPLGAAQVLEVHHVRRVFSQYRWGGYLEAEGFRPWIDGRGQMWSVVGRLQEYVAGRGASASPLAVIAFSGDSWALVAPGEPYLYALQESSRWRVVVSSAGYSLFHKKGGA